MTHTPGPWELVSIDGIGWAVFGPRDENGMKQPIHCPDFPLSLSNGRLVAAVPEMLEACEAVLSFDWDTLLAEAGGEPYSPDYTWTQVKMMLQAIIAKARGE